MLWQEREKINGKQDKFIYSVASVDLKTIVKYLNKSFLSVVSMSTLVYDKKDIFSIRKIHLLILSCEWHQFQYSSSMVCEMRFTQDLAMHELL